MGIYVCALCGHYTDDDYDPPIEYKDELICESCAETLPGGIEDEPEPNTNRDSEVPRGR